MKPDKKTCLNCGKEIEGKKMYCDDACRMAFKRQPEQTSNPNTNKPEHLVPEQPNPNKDEFRATLTKTDKTFYDRAIRDFSGDKNYYRFTGDNNDGKLQERVCLNCGDKFKTLMPLLKYCSYEHYSETIGGKK